MANLFCSFARFGRNKARFCGIANDATTYLLLKKFEFTRYFTAFPSIDSDDIVKTSNYSSLFKGQTESRKSVVTKKLVELFGIQYNEASRLVDSSPVLAKVGSANIIKTAEAADRVGILDETILKYPWILSLPSGDLKYADKILRMFHGNINETAPLLIIPMYKLTFFSSLTLDDRKIIPQKSRLIYFSENLERDVLTICETFSKHQYLFMIPFTRIHKIMTLLFDANIQKPDILNDLWIFRHCQISIEKRVQIIKEAEIPRVKPWMLRCPDTALNATVNRQLKNKLLLGSHPSVSSYLHERLKCSEEDISYIIKIHPVIGKTNVAKLKRIIDLLYAEGYSSNSIIACPRVLAHSFDTVRNRIVKLHMLGYNGKSLTKLCLSQQKFDEFLSKLSE